MEFFVLQCLRNGSNHNCTSQGMKTFLICTGPTLLKININFMLMIRMRRVLRLCYIAAQKHHIVRAVITNTLGLKDGIKKWSATSLSGIFIKIYKISNHRICYLQVFKLLINRSKHPCLLMKTLNWFAFC